MYFQISFQSVNSVTNISKPKKNKSEVECGGGSSFSCNTGDYCDLLIEMGRVRQSAVIHCQIRPFYSKLGIIAYVRFNRATD